MESAVVRTVGRRLRQAISMSLLHTVIVTDYSPRVKERLKNGPVGEGALTLERKISGNRVTARGAESYNGREVAEVSQALPRRALSVALPQAWSPPGRREED